MHAILRPTILYAVDMYYSLKETEMRQLERIEEGYLMKICCPIVQMYLELSWFQRASKFKNLNVYILNIFSA